MLREDVLDHGFVELEDVMPRDIPEGAESRDIAIVNAARVSYLGESKGRDSDRKLLAYLYRHQHTSPFEQVIFKFIIKAPILVWWQLDRHRTFKYGRQNRQSGRYTEYNDEFYSPVEWRLQDNKNKQGSTEDSIKLMKLDTMIGDWVLSIEDRFKEHVSDSLYWYKELINNGVAREQARLFLPAFALYHTTVLNVDAWNLIHFLKLRTDEHAQWEIRQYANVMEKMFAEILPWTYEEYKNE